MLDGCFCCYSWGWFDDVLFMIDYFFWMLVDVYDWCVIGIVMLGIGFDGVVGLSCIKEVGGIMFVQMLDDVEYVEMLQYVIVMVCVDIVLLVVDML